MRVADRVDGNQCAWGLLDQMASRFSCVLRDTPFRGQATPPNLVQERDMHNDNEGQCL